MQTGESIRSVVTFLIATGMSRSGAMDEVGTELGDRPTAELTEHAVDLAGEYLQRPLDAVRTSGGEAIQGRAPQHHGVRAEGQSLHDISSPTKAAIDDGSHAAAHGRGDLREHVEWGDAGVQLSSAMVRDHDALTAEVSGSHGVRNVQNPFQ